MARSVYFGTRLEDVATLVWACAQADRPVELVLPPAMRPEDESVMWTLVGRLHDVNGTVARVWSPTPGSVVAARFGRFEEAAEFLLSWATERPSPARDEVLFCARICDGEDYGVFAASCGRCSRCACVTSLAEAYGMYGVA